MAGYGAVAKLWRAYLLARPKSLSEHGSDVAEEAPLQLLLHREQLPQVAALEHSKLRRVLCRVLASCENMNHEDHTSCA